NRKADVDRALALEPSVGPGAVDLGELAQRKRAGPDQEVRHGDLVRAGHGIFELLTHADRQVDAGFDRDLKLGDGRFGLGHATGDRRLHPTGLDDLDIRAARPLGGRLRPAPVGSRPAASGGDPVLFADATCAVGSGSFGLDPAAPSFFGWASFAAGSAPASPIFAIGAPILAGTPCSTRICSVPSASASRSNVALSDSTSARTSPVFTSSPLFFFHSTMVPSSIVSDSLGMLTSGIGLFSERRADQALDVLRGRDRRLLQRQPVGHGDLRATQPPDGRV